MPKKTNEKVRSKVKKCECKIRGVVEMYDIRKGIYWNLHPDNIVQRLRQFKFCPIRIIKLRRKKERGGLFIDVGKFFNLH